MTHDDGEHWFHRLTAGARAWLNDNPRSALSTEVFDAVISAGGVPTRRRRDSADPASEGHYLDVADAEYIEELRRAGEHE